MYYTGQATLLSSTAITGTGSAAHGNWVSTAEYFEASVVVNVTAISAGTLTITLDYADASAFTATSPTYITTSVVSFSGITTTGTYRVAITNFGPAVRLSYSLDNTDTATFSAVLIGKGFGPG